MHVLFFTFSSIAVSMERHNCLRSMYYIIFGAFYIIFGYLVDIFGRIYIYLVDNFVYLVNISWALAHFSSYPATL